MLLYGLDRGPGGRGREQAGPARRRAAGQHDLRQHCGSGQGVRGAGGRVPGDLLQLPPQAWERRREWGWITERRKERLWLPQRGGVSVCGADVDRGPNPAVAETSGAGLPVSRDRGASVRPARPAITGPGGGLNGYSPNPSNLLEGSVFDGGFTDLRSHLCSAIERFGVPGWSSTLDYIEITRVR